MKVGFMPEKREASVESASLAAWTSLPPISVRRVRISSASEAIEAMLAYTPRCQKNQKRAMSMRLRRAIEDCRRAPKNAGTRRSFRGYMTDSERSYAMGICRIITRDP